MRAPKRYTTDVRAVIDSLVDSKSNKDIAQILTERFPDKGVFTASHIHTYKTRFGIKPKGKRIMPTMYQSPFPPGMYEFVKENVAGRTSAELTHLINDHYGCNITVKQVIAFKKNHHLPSGINTRYQKGNIPYTKGRHVVQSEKAIQTQFKKGEMPHNYLPVGSRVKNGEGYWIEKVADPHSWKFLHRLEWERNNGPIPADKVVIFLDGNKDNCNIENLALISREEHFYLLRHGLRFDNADLTLTGMNIAKLASAPKHRKEKT